jgi:hypothetical protein
MLNPPNRHGTDPYAWWCGRGGIARGPPIPIYGVLSVAENRNRQTMPSSRCGVLAPYSGSGSADFEHVADLSLAAWGGLTASLGAFDLPLADIREDGAEVLVLDNARL